MPLPDNDHTRGIAVLESLWKKEEDELARMKDRYKKITYETYKAALERHIDLQESLVRDLKECIKHLNKLSTKPLGT